MLLATVALAVSTFGSSAAAMSAPPVAGSWDASASVYAAGETRTVPLAPRPQAPRQSSSSSQGHAGLFPPTDLGLLETPDRVTWQKPEQIMDALKIAEGAKVADIGAGAGFFTIPLANRVGPNGVVYAQDIQHEMIEAIRRRVGREGLKNVETVLGSETDPNLPRGMLDAVLVVDSYQEIEPEHRVDFLRRVARALKPVGRIGVVNYKPGGGGPGPDLRVDRAQVEADARAAGLRVVDRADLPFQYLLVLARNDAAPAAP